MARTQATIDSPSLAIHIGALVTPEKQCNAGNLISMTTSPQGIELADLALGASCPGSLENNRSHASFNQARTDGIYSDASSGKLVRHGLGPIETTAALDAE